MKIRRVRVSEIWCRGGSLRAKRDDYFSCWVLVRMELSGGTLKGSGLLVEDNVTVTKTGRRWQLTIPDGCLFVSYCPLSWWSRLQVLRAARRYIREIWSV